MMARLTAFFFLLVVTATAWAGFDEGYAAYQKGDYATALQEFQSMAEQGDAASQYSLGVMYERGEGVQKNDEEAVKWYRKAVEQGLSLAQFNLGLMYERGEGVQKNDEEAVKWYRKAAEQGDADAMGNMGWYIANGWGEEKNIIEGERLLKLAASKGNEWAAGKLRLVQEAGACLKKSSTLIFGEALNCTSKFNLRKALKNGGLNRLVRNSKPLFGIGIWQNTA